MAIYDIYSEAISGLDWTESLQGTILASASATILLQGTDGTVLMLSGSGFKFDENDPTRPIDGTISAIRHYNNQGLGTLHAEITGLNVSLIAFFGNLDHIGPTVLGGADTIETHVVGGTVSGYGGGDTIQLEGDNTVHATGGSDTIQGSPTPAYENDWVSYEFNPDGTLNTAGVEVVLDASPFPSAPFVRQGTARDIFWVGSVPIFGNNETDTLVGIDHVRGSHGNDIIRGAQTGGGGGLPPTFSIVYGLGGNDFISGAQFVYGGSGNDEIAPNSTGGEYYGENDNDTFLFVSIANADSTILIDGGSGIDTFEFRSSSPTAGIQIDLDSNIVGVLGGVTQFWDHWSFVSVENVIGGGGDDVLIGTTGANEIRGAGGGDYIEGLAGDDVLHGGAGNDVLWGDNDPNGQNGQNPSSGSDTLLGGDGNDVLYGGAGIDHLSGGLGADQHIGGTGLDFARYDDANYGNLTIRLDNSALNVGAAAVGDTYVDIECLVAGAGNDTVVGDNLANRLFGGGGTDTILGRNGADILDGGEGIDHLYGGLGADQHIGGDGLDFARYDDANYGNLTIRLDNAALNVGAAAVGDTYSGIECLVAGAGNDTVVGDNFANRLFGQGGTDTILGRDGNDILDGGEGNDHLYGGLGADQHIGGAGLDFARYDDANYGNLTIRLDNAALNVGAAAVGDTYNGIECLVGGLGNDTVVGDNLANRLYGQGGTDTIYGQAGNDILDGGAGNDFLNGGLGNDTLTGGANNDTFFFNTTLNAATNVDTITDFSVPNDTIRLEDAIFTAIGPVGTLAAAAFTIGAAATTAAHRIVYNSATGALIYDSNGSAAGGATQFAILGTGLALTNADFLIT